MAFERLKWHTKGLKFFFNWMEKTKPFTPPYLHLKMVWGFVVCLFIFTKYFKVCLASNAFLSKAHSFRLQSPIGSPGSHGTGTSSRAQRSTPAADIAWLPLLSPPVSLNVAMSASSHRLVNIISDLLLPLVQADIICGSDLTWMIESYTLQKVGQL